MSQLYIGMISGTSADGIDVVLTEFAGSESSKPMSVLAQQTFQYPQILRNDILNLSQPADQAANQRLDQLGHLDQQVAIAFAQAAKDICQQAKIPLKDVQAIGSHGQTLRHRPSGSAPFTLQIGDPNVIAYQTGVTTVADFRRMDLAAGGQGAPLVPLFHQWLYSDQDNNQAILNLGGIANLTWLPKDNGSVLGFDTGPANAFSDYWIQKHHNKSFDKNGEWASQGKVNKNLLDTLLNDKYFTAPVPKSTGREYFDKKWLEQHLENFNQVSPVDIQATLIELTAVTVAMHFKYFPKSCDSLVLCGGGAHNHYLVSRLVAHIDKNVELNSLKNTSVDGDFVEACAFAWLAKQRFDQRKLDYRSVTGAECPLLYGNIFS